MTFHQAVRSRHDVADLRVMIVDDSIVARSVLQRMLDECPGFTVGGIARSADQALALLAETRVDIILLDVEMPGMDGLTALPAILTAGQGAHVVIVSSACADGAVATLHALALGASDTLLKPSAGDLGAGFSAQLAERLRRLGPARRQAPVQDVPPPIDIPVPTTRTDPIGCIAIGASTGGLLALAKLFDALDGYRDVPILVTQHLPAEFMPYFADQVAEMAGRPAMVAVAGQALVRGEILIAPGVAHLSLVRDPGDHRVRVHYDRAPAVSACLPSVDPMFDAMAAMYGAAGIGVVLSGMGRDGSIGARRLAAAGGEILVQDAASATVWGMPGTIARAGLADAVLTPAAIGRRITARAAAGAALSPVPSARPLIMPITGSPAWK